MHSGEELKPVDKTELFSSLPTGWATDLIPQIQALLRDTKQKVFVLDDDPTGTQTVHDIIVLTEWTIDALRLEMESADAVCYILTNSRQRCVRPGGGDQRGDRAQFASGVASDGASLYDD